LGDDPRGIVLAERRAQFGHRIGDDVLHRRATFPHGLEQFVAGDHLIDMLQQHCKQLQRLALHVRRHATHRQFKARLVEFGAAKSVAKKGRWFFAFHFCDSPVFGISREFSALVMQW